MPADQVTEPGESPAPRRRRGADDARRTPVIRRPNRAAARLASSQATAAAIPARQPPADPLPLRHRAAPIPHRGPHRGRAQGTVAARSLSRRTENRQTPASARPQTGTTPPRQTAGDSGVPRPILVPR
jgi:hypothetical protein